VIATRGRALLFLLTLAACAAHPSGGARAARVELQNLASSSIPSRARHCAPKWSAARTPTRPFTYKRRRIAGRGGARSPAHRSGAQRALGVIAQVVRDPALRGAKVRFFPRGAHGRRDGNGAGPFLQFHDGSGRAWAW